MVSKLTANNIRGCSETDELISTLANTEIRDAMVLNRSFKPAKCKTALKLAVSRIKVLKNKSEGQLKQLKRELAELLASGHEPTSRIIRVQHLVKEENTMAAYELIQMFCEFIVIRFPIIESQKICPTDLKEAMSSVVFASPRCADIPELLDVKKHFTAKYGKEFISAAVELRPQCGVNSLLVEKLSLKTPDGPTTMKILNAIAEEYNVKWEPNPFGDIDAKCFHDFQTINEKASCEESPQAHAPPVHGEKGHPNKEINDVPTTTNLYMRYASFAVENAGGGGNRLTTAYRSFPEIKSSGGGSGSEEMYCRNSNSESNSCYGGGIQNWSMEFKDAASAAQAAAESAEQASMATRTAAELSKREKTKMRQFSTYGSQNTCLGDGLPQEFGKTFYSQRHGNVASMAASEFRVHGNGSSRQFSTQEGREYGVQDAKHVSAQKKPSHVHPRLPEYDSFAANFRSLKLNNKTRQ